MSNNTEVVLNYLKKIAPNKATNSQIAKETRISPHQQVFQITSNLLNRKIIKGIKENRDWEFWVADSEYPELIDLFNKYTNNPRSDWISDYEAIVSQVDSIRENNLRSINEELLRKLWLNQANGITNVGQGVLYKREFEAIKAELPGITSKIIKSPTSATYTEVINWAEEAKTKGKLEKMIRLVINRVFSAADPYELSTIVNENQLDELINELNHKYKLNLIREDNWFLKNQSLMRKLRSIGIEHARISITNTFVWQLYVWLVKQQGLVSSSLSKEHVLKAIEEIDSVGLKQDEKSSTYDLIHNAKRYPPKLVYSLAHKHVNGEILDRSSFEGGEDTPCFNTLRELGFIIERKDFVHTLLTNFKKQADDSVDLVTRDYPNKYSGLDLKVSFGIGNFAKIPWISFTGYEQTTSNGIYPVYLYYKNIGVLILAYGISETNKPRSEWNLPNGTEKIKDYLIREYDHVPERYGESYVFAIYQYPIDFTEATYTKDLDRIINEYKETMNDLFITIPFPKPMPLNPTEPVIEAILEPKDISNSFADALLKANISFGIDHADRVRAFVSSLMTKPLVILTGLSGSGKTQIAIRFGEWLGEERMLVATVRPDWTGAEALFGYEDALKPIVNGKASWAVPETLSFILEASKNPSWPYLLVLDEMNLAHVERYFADVLSGMESGHPCIPNLRLEDDGCWRIVDQEPAKIKFPKNIFVVGTVNVDETTYMFSPKVLDRANTFEFRVTTNDLADDYIKPKECETGDPGLIRGFLEIGRDDAWHRQNGFADMRELAEQLRIIHFMLAEYGFEFGHRVFYESQRFAAIYGATADLSSSNILDLIVMQKLLPRLHGPRRRLEDLLRNFAKYCFDKSIVINDTTTASVFEPEEKNLNDAELPISFDKITRMLRSLRTNQFTSFTE